MSKYSVVITAYNAEKYIEECIRSVLKQSDQDFEIIVVDDCSNDNTANIIKELSEQDNRIRYLKTDVNSGVAAARNYGIKESSSEWIALLDMDDAWSSNKIETQFKSLKNSGMEIACTGTFCVDDDGNPLNNIFRIPTTITYNELLKNNLINGSSILIKKNILEKYPFEKSELHEDYLCWLKILKDGHTVCGIDEPLTIYRIRKNSRSHNKFLSAIRTWKTLKYAGVPFFERMKNFIHYASHGIKRYIIKNKI